MDDLLPRQELILAPTPGQGNPPRSLTGANAALLVLTEGVAVALPKWSGVVHGDSIDCLAEKHSGVAV